MTDLESKIRELIAAQGRIAFAEFMRLALYDPEGGYYTSPSAFGVAGDYYTSPATHPVFGALVAVQLHRMWEMLERPVDFTVVEMGAGSGLLSGDVLDCVADMPDEFAGSVRYVALDRYSPDETPAFTGGSHRIVALDIPLRGVTGCFLSNELVDSFPVHRFQVHHGTIMEVYVTLGDDGEFTEVLDQPSTPDLEDRLRSLGITLREGQRGEVNLDVSPWLEQVSAALDRGFVMTIDYGYEASELYGPERQNGTLQTYFRHTLGASPYQRVGRQDITAHVDFSAITSTGQALGLGSVGLMTQARFLDALGIAKIRRLLRSMGLNERELSANLMAVRELVSPEGLGRFMVLVQERNTGVQGLDLLAPREGLVESLKAPLLTERHMPLMEGRYPHLDWDPGDLWPFGREES